MDFWDLTLRFFALGDVNVRNVVAGSMLLGCSAGCLSTFVYLQRQSLIGDALAHAALPGVGLAFLVAGSRELGFLLAGAALTAWLAALVVNLIVRTSAIKLDAALGIVLSVFFGAGVVILTHIQKSGAGNQAGLDRFLFGQAAAISGRDVRLLLVVTGLLLLAVAAGFSRFKILSFDRGFAQTLGVPVGRWQFLLTTMVVAAVVIGLQAVGVVLMAAMMITPAASARQWTDRLWLMTLLASLFGMIAGLIGAYVSFLAPRLPTGPWIVVVVSLIFGVSVLLAPRRGLLSHMVGFIRQRRATMQDHILKALYKAGMASGVWDRGYDRVGMATAFGFLPGDLGPALGRLRRRGYLERVNGAYRLSARGREEGARVLRLHRLWEVYLSRYLELPADHVHRDAHEMEHILTPEMEARLEELLERPEFDPHAQKIPYPERRGPA